MNSLPVPTEPFESADQRLLSLGSVLVAASLGVGFVLFQHGDVAGALSLLLTAAAGVLFLGIGLSPNAD